jgi:hypothetical protein
VEAVSAVCAGAVIVSEGETVPVVAEPAIVMPELLAAWTTMLLPNDVVPVNFDR